MREDKDMKGHEKRGDKETRTLEEMRGYERREGHERRLETRVDMIRQN